MKTRRVKRIVLTWSLRFLVAVVLFLIVGVTVFAVMQIKGKSSLYDKAEYKTPELSAIESAELVQEPVTEADDGYEWQEGDIRYRDEIYRYNDEMLTFLFMGIDSMKEVERKKPGIKGGQSDAMFLLCIDPKNEQIKMIGINRDTITDIDVYTKEGNFMATTPGQITLQHAYGDGAEVSCERSVTAVRRLFYDIPIHGYCAINMGAIPLINDAVGGVEVVALESVKRGDPPIVEGEKISLQGMNAYYYLHDRDTGSFNSAGRRLDRQKQYLAEYAKKAIAKTKQDITLPVNLYQTLNKYMVTDISLDEVTYLASELTGYRFDVSSIYSLEGETVMGEKFEEFYPDQESLYDLIMNVFYEKVEISEIEK